MQLIKNDLVFLFDFTHLSPGLFLGEIYEDFLRISFLYVLITSIHFFVILSL